MATQFATKPQDVNGKKPKMSHTNAKKLPSSKKKPPSSDEDDSQFIVINKYMKLDLKSNVLLSNDKIDSGTRILIELPLFKIGRPTQTSHPGNSLFLYHSFINSLNEDLQKEILYKTYPLKKLNKSIAEHTANLKTLIKKNDQLNDESVIRYNDKQWKEIEILQNIFHSYSISLQLFLDSYQVVQDHYSNVRSQNDDNDNDDTTSHIVDLGKGLYSRASHLLHSCNPFCRVNVIDAKGTIEIRTLMDVPGPNVPLTRNFLDDTRGLGITKSEHGAYTRVLMNDDINLMPCNMRCKLLLSNYHFLCSCPKCLDWDRTRGLLCSSASNSNGCKGVLWSRPPYLSWTCQTCKRLVKKEKLSHVLEVEKSLLRRLGGIEDIIDLFDYNFSKGIDVSKLLYSLLDECSAYLAENHWIILRLLWICFEEKLSRNLLPDALRYLKQHCEGCENINDYGMNPSIIMANKYELISDLLPYDEIYKVEAIKKALQLRKLLNGDAHASVKRCLNKLRFYTVKYQQTIK
eukprot:849983_1